MKFNFEVGNREKHQITFSFNQMFGNLKITVDGETLKRDFRLLSFNLIKKYEFNVGVQERHKIVIEKERKLLLAGFRPQKYRVFVDDKLLQEHEGF